MRALLTARLTRRMSIAESGQGAQQALRRRASQAEYSAGDTMTGMRSCDRAPSFRSASVVMMAQVCRSFHCSQSPAKANSAPPEG